MKGDFDAVAKMAEHPRFVAKVTDMLEAAPLPDKEVLTHAIKSANANPKAMAFLTDMSSAWRDNRFTGKLLPGMADQIPKKFVDRTSKGVDQADLAGRITGVVGTTAADMTTGVINAGKHIYGDSRVTAPGLGRFRAWITDKFLKKPLTKQYGKGTVGTSSSAPVKAANKYLLNSLTHEVQQLSNATGRLAQKHGITTAVQRANKLKNQLPSDLPKPIGFGRPTGFGN